jgi:uncharacterized cupredoxin-like copper-binding protein
MAPRSIRPARLLSLIALTVALASCGRGGAASKPAPQPGRVSIEVHAYEVKSNVDTVQAGNVTFAVSNTDVLIHEMLVVPLPASALATAGGKGAAGASGQLLIEQLLDRMAYDQATLRLDEDHLGSLGEVSELEGGHTGEATLNLQPGNYLLLCNLPLHFQSGMWHQLTVTP